MTITPQTTIDLSTFTDDELSALQSSVQSEIERRKQTDAPCVTLRSRYRDVNARVRGEEYYRMVLHDGRLIWADRHPDAIVVSDTWCERGPLAEQRRCATHVQLPVGLVVVEIEKSVGRGSNKPSYAAGRLLQSDTNPEKGRIDWEAVKHKGVRRKKGSYVHVLEIDGQRMEVS